MARIEGIAEGLRAGIFPVWINGFLLNGYGVPSGIMYPDTLLYLPALLRLAGLPLSAVYNAYWIFITIFSMAGSYYAYSRWLKSFEKGCMAAVLYNSCLLFIFSSGLSAGACMAMAVFPATLHGLWDILQGNGKKWYLLVLGASVICQSHLISTLLLFLMMMSMLVIFRRGLQDKKRCRLLGTSAFLMLMLNLWRLVPLVDFYPRMLFHINDTANYIPGISNSLHNTSFSMPELWHNGFVWGWPLTVLTVFFALYRLKKWRESRGWYAVMLMMLLITLGMWQSFPWQAVEKIPLIGSILPKFQFSMRFIQLAMVPLAYYLALYAAEILQRKSCGRYLAACACVLLSIWSLCMNMSMEFGFLGSSVKKYSSYAFIQEVPAEGVFPYEDYLYADISFDSLKNRQGGHRQGGAADIYTPAEVLGYTKAGSTLELSYRAAEDTSAELPMFFYHGYTGRLEDGRNVTVGQTDAHIMTAQLPAGEHKLTIWYRGLWSYRIAGWLSLGGLLLFLRLWYRWNLCGSGSL